MKTIAVIAFLGAVLGFVGHQDHKDTEIAHAHYCDMVRMHSETNGAAGWPAYKGGCK